MKGQQQANDDLGYNGFNVSLFYLAPIQFENIQDPNVTIALKNITKKNAVTKEKRLGEFLKLLENKSFDIYDYYVLMCWIQSYPRLALDSSKPVRQLAHQVQATYMHQYGAKEFSPYLKSTLPIWLQGLYDDKSIGVSVRANLLKNFTNDKTKVDSKIWIIFHEQIVNYCHHVLVNQSGNTISDERSDSADELKMKYERAVVSAVSMLTKIISLANSTENFLAETAQGQMEEILKSEKLWDFLESFSGEKTLNLSLFKSLLALISEVFSLDQTQNLKPVTRSIGEIRSVYKIISKKFIKLVKVSDSAQSNPTVIYSNVIIQLINVLVILTKLTSKTNSVDKKKYKLKKNFWQIGGSKSNSRLNDYIKLGPCNSDPVYYRYLGELFNALKSAQIQPDEDFSFLNFSKAKDATKILVKILLPQCSKLNGPNAMNFKEEATKCILDVSDLFEVDLSGDGVKYTLLLTLLDNISTSRVRPEDKVRFKSCIARLAEFAKTHDFDFSEISEKIVRCKDNKVEGQGYSLIFRTSKAQLLSNYYLLLTSIGGSAPEDFLSVVFETLEESFEADSISDFIAFFIAVLQNSEGSEANILDWAVESLPAFISNGFVDLPVSLVKCVLERRKSGDLAEFCSDCFSKISIEEPQKLSRFLDLVFQHDVFDPRSIDKSHPEIYSYCLSLAKNSSRSEAEKDLVLRLVNQPSILEALVASNPSDSEKQKLLTKLVSQGKELDGVALKDFVNYAVMSCDETCKEFLRLINDQSLVQQSVFDVITSSQANTDFSKLALFVSESHSDLLFTKIEQELVHAFEHVDVSSLALANPLGQNIYLFNQPESIGLFPSVVSIRSFLGDYLRFPQSNDLKHLSWFAKAFEYCEDFEFLSESGSAMETPKSLQDFYDSGVFRDSIDESALSEIFNGKHETGILGNISADLNGKWPFNLGQFYSAKVLIRLLSNSFENMSLSSFDKLDIQYTRLAGSPLMLATFLCSASKFVGHSSKLDRVRNYVFGEVLGVRSTSDILSSGVIWTALATNFLKDVKYDILPSHKMAMVINQVSGWLDSEIAFDDKFENMRVLLSQFLARLISSVDEVPDKTWEVSADLCLNNLSTAQVKPNSQALKYFTLKLFVTLANSVDRDVYPGWNERKAEIYQDIFEILHQESAVSNQPVRLVNEILERVLRSSKFSKAFLNEKAPGLYNLLSASKIEDLQRAAVSLLCRQIYEQQQDVIVDYQFKSAKDDAEGSGEVDDLVKLPHSLLTNIRDLKHHLDDYISHEKYAEVTRYLWSWLLIFAHFEDSTISMKAAYTEQIKKENAVEKLLGTVFDCLDLTDSKFLRSLVVNPIDKNAKVTPENCVIQDYQVSKGMVGRSIKEEVLFLLTHLYYLSFRFLGSSAQQWFQELRDLQLKQRIQKFSVNYISPILISRMLDDVEKTKDKLSQGDDNFTIKVNRVTNEIKSSYVIDEQNMEMVVKIPEAFPLSNVLVEGPLRLGVKENRWKAWLLASQRVISLTNGSITDCIELFNKNVNLHFSGFEECAICYSILHSDHSLPSKDCPTCSNKFHSACLYKWFKSSGSSTCPLCRSTFNFRATRG